MEVGLMSTETITNDARHAVVNRARTSRIREHLARLDGQRALAEASALGVTQSALASELRVTQPTISSALKTARSTPPAAAGFHGATPYEVCQRYAVGEITREVLVDELTRWPMRPARATDGLDWITGDVGEWNEQVGPALDEGLIDDETYDAVLKLRAAHAR
jgi:hypothetical protein